MAAKIPPTQDYSKDGTPMCGRCRWAKVVCRCDRTRRIITIHGVEYPNGERAACYALENNGTACCVSVNEAMALYRQGIPFVPGGHFMPDDFATFFMPDFQPIGSPALSYPTRTEDEP